MIKNVFSKFLDINQREITRLEKIVDEVAKFEQKAKKLKDSDFPKKTEELKKRLAKGENLVDLLPESYALVREASSRVLGLRPYDVQIMAATALFEGKVAEQKTGEGKTLSAVPALYLRALAGKGAHLVTVNDYLARRDAGWNGPVFEFLGMSVGSIIQEGKSYVYDSSYSDTSHGDERLSHLRPSERKEAYLADITYGTNNEFGFDYLRDNMVNSLDSAVQRGHYFAVVDEVDSVLIDEARTPLIISAPDTDPTDKYYRFAELVEKLDGDTDYIIDEKSRSASLTEHGITRVEKLLGVKNLYEEDFDAIHHIENALRAKTIFQKNVDYVIKEDQVIIVDEFTGRLMFGRRWGDGMHQAVEAKEGVPIQQESKTLATISFQNYFRMYEVLSGMTGTAATEAEEFKKIYDLDVVVIPTNRPNARIDHGDVVYKTLRAKYGAVVSEIEEKHKIGQPVLVGTTSIEKNEIISRYLKKKKIPHEVLNAKNHEKEAAVLASAGKPGAVTVATNMAGRGVDIVLGGSVPDKPEGVSDEAFKKSEAYKNWLKRHKEVLNSGGLHVIGTERHNSRRIDNQLRGRSGRQGDPGSTKFYLSLEDDLMRIFGGEQIGSLMDRLRLPEDQPIENKLIGRAIEQAQVKVEGANFDSRKGVVEYDDVINQQREIVYKLRNKVLVSKDLKDEILAKLEERLFDAVDYAVSVSEKESEVDELILVSLLEIAPFDEGSKENIKKELAKIEGVEKKKSFLRQVVGDVYAAREKQVGPQVMREIEKYAYLGSVDKEWIDHIDRVSDLKEGVRLRAYGQRDPLAEFKNEAFEMFENLLSRIDEELSRRLFRTGVVARKQEIPIDSAKTNVDVSDEMGLSGGEDVAAEIGEPAFASATQSMPSNSSKNEKLSKIGRNDPCWCGSGKKWKKCHYPNMGK